MMLITYFFLVSVVFSHPCGRDMPGYRTWIKAVDPTDPDHEYHILASSFHEFPLLGLNLSCCWTRESDNSNIDCVELPPGGSLEIVNDLLPRNTPEVFRSRSASRERRHSRSRSVSSQSRAESPLAVSPRRVSPVPRSLLVDTIEHVIGDDPQPLYVDRSDIIESSAMALSTVNMQKVYNNGLRVMFTNERGLDLGGLLSEWISEVSRAGFASSAFVRSDTHLLSPNPAFQNFNIYEFYGRFIAIAFKEKRALGVEFAPAVLKFILSEDVNLRDLKAVDPQYVKSLMRLKSMPDLSEFTFTTANWKGEAVDLVPNGSRKILTHDNINQYILLVARYKMFTSIRTALINMKKGFDSLFLNKLDITANVLRMKLLGESEISIMQFANNVAYGSSSDAFREVLGLFYKVIMKFTQPQRKILLKFITGRETLPLGGFAALPRKITLEPYNVSADHLPSSSTCGLILRLPPYKTETEMRKKLLQAINGVNTFEII